jgi:hypothetical protein
MFYELQEAVTELLRADTELMAKAPLYDYVPEDAQKPYLTFTSMWTATRDSLNRAVERVWFQISVWSDHRGFKEASQIAMQVVRLLRHTKVDLGRYGVQMITGDNTHLLRDRDPNVRHFALTFYVPYVPLGRIVRSA